MGVLRADPVLMESPRDYVKRGESALTIDTERIHMVRQKPQAVPSNHDPL